jgi:hypothetical protein
MPFITVVEMSVRCDFCPKERKPTDLVFDCAKAEKMAAYLRRYYGHEGVIAAELVAAQAVAIGWERPSIDTWQCPLCIPSKEAARG